MIPRIATVLSARPWEPGLIALARETAAVRPVLRAYRPEEVTERAAEIDVVVAGAETTWVTPALIASWRRSGLAVVGLYPAGDAPARRLLETGGADEVLADDTPPSALIQLIRLLPIGAQAPAPQPKGQMVAVTGARGAPGRSEVALALAWRWARSRPTILIDLDLDAPNLAVRLGLPPRPDVTDAADTVRETGVIPDRAVQRVGALAVVVGSHRPGEPPLRESLAEDVVEAATATFDLVVADLGPARPDDRLLKRAHHAVLVVEGSASGVVRAARVTAEWSGPPPLLVINRVTDPGRGDLLVAARRWTGLEPAAWVPHHPRVLAAARAARPPHRRMLRPLRRVEVPTP